MTKVTYFFRKNIYFLLTDLYYYILDKADHISQTWGTQSNTNTITKIRNKISTQEIKADYDNKYRSEGDIVSDDINNIEDQLFR